MRASQQPYKAVESFWVRATWFQQITPAMSRPCTHVDMELRELPEDAGPPLLPAEAFVGISPATPNPRPSFCAVCGRRRSVRWSIADCAKFVNGRLNRVTLAEWRSRVRLSSINALFSSGGVARCLAAIRDSPKTLYAFLIVSAVLLVPYAMPFVDRRNVFAWDILLLSGFATLALGLVLARSGPPRLERMLDRLVRRGVLITIEPLSDIKTDLKKKHGCGEPQAR
jgi:hypothetical protein